MTPCLPSWPLVGGSTIHRDGDGHGERGGCRGRWGVCAELEAAEVP